MESFLLLLVGIRDWISDLFHYFLEEVVTDRRRLLKVILALLAVVLVIIGIRSLVSHGKKNAEQAALEPESQMVIPISIGPSQTPAPEATVVGAAGDAGTSLSPTPTPVAATSGTSGGVTVTNGYVQKKNGGGSPSLVTGTSSTTYAAPSAEAATEAETAGEGETREGE